MCEVRGFSCTFRRDEGTSQQSLQKRSIPFLHSLLIKSTLLASEAIGCMRVSGSKPTGLCTVWKKADKYTKGVWTFRSVLVLSVAFGMDCDGSNPVTVAREARIFQTSSGELGYVLAPHGWFSV